ncbi:MAG: CDP-glycerol glycerophosphotransferase family protein [Clostridiales bacterium]|nr:CDP-glycerol glycerophosphotransferase family protein [Clostridiales bacterium]
MFYSSLYIDPGTGSMLFSILIGIVGVLVFAIRTFWIKLKFVITGGRAKNNHGRSLPICIFSEGKRYWNVFHPICDEFEKRKIDVYYYTATEDDPALKENYKYVHPEFIGEGNKAISKMNLIRADIILATTPSLDVFQWKRSKEGKYYVHIPHMANDINIYRMFGLDFYDAVLLSGQYQADQIRRLESIRGIQPKELKLVGIPYMDVMRERLNNSSKTSNERPVVLLAPSWGESGILKVYGKTLIDALIDTGYEIVIRPHPQSFVSEKELMDSLMTSYPDGDKVSWNRDADNFDILNRADILISDFSGVLFDFSLVFDKPIIYADTEFDRSPYDCAWDDEELWTFKVLPTIGRELNKDNYLNIGNMVSDCLNGSEAEELAIARDKAREETWCNIDNGAEKVVDYLIAKHKEITKT